MTVDSSKLDITISKFLILYAVFYFVFTDVGKKVKSSGLLEHPHTCRKHIYRYIYKNIKTIFKQRLKFQNLCSEMGAGDKSEESVSFVWNHFF